MESHRFARDVRIPKGAPGLKFGTSQNACRTAPRSCYFLANSSSVLPILRHVESRCSAMLEYRAYVHHYERYGTTAEDLEALASLRARRFRLRRPRSRAGAARRGDGVFDAAAAAAALVFFSRCGYDTNDHQPRGPPRRRPHASRGSRRHAADAARDAQWSSRRTRAMLRDRRRGRPLRGRTAATPALGHAFGDDGPPRTSTSRGSSSRLMGDGVTTLRANAVMRQRRRRRAQHTR